MSTELETELAEEVDLPEGPRRIRIARGIAGLVVFVAVWWIGALLSPVYILPAPDLVVQTFLAELRSGAMVSAVANSVVHWIPGTLVGTSLGVAAGILLGWSGVADDAAAPVVRLLRPVPPLALIGFAIAWFGLTHVGAAFIIAAGAFWINFYAAYGGVESVSGDLLDAGRALGLDTDWGLVRKVVLPAASPEILTGVRTGVGRCWMLIIAAELIGVPGVGRKIIVASNNLATDVVIAYILVMSLFYLVIDTAFRRAQRRILAWRA